MKYLISYNPNDNTSNVHSHVHTNTDSMDHKGQKAVDHTSEYHQYHNYFERKMVKQLQYVKIRESANFSPQMFCCIKYLVKFHKIYLIF